MKVSINKMQEFEYVLNLNNYFLYQMLLLIYQI